MEVGNVLPKFYKKGWIIVGCDWKIQTVLIIANDVFLFVFVFEVPCV